MKILTGNKTFRPVSRLFSVNLDNSITRRRNWFDVSPPKRPTGNETITVSTYNLLSQQYMWPEVYNHIPSKYTSWQYRLPLINRNLMDLSRLADIMCFQEMEFNVYQETWKPLLKDHGFDSIFQKKRPPTYWTKSEDQLDGVSIFVNSNKFDLLSYEPVDYSEHFQNPEYFTPTQDLRERAMTRNTVALIATVRHKRTGTIIFVTNTHLYWSPEFPDVKVLQAYLLVRLLKRTMRNHYKVNDNQLSEIMRQGQASVLLVGDFNSTPDSMVYEFLQNGSLNIAKDTRFNYDYGKLEGAILKTGLLEFESQYKSLVHSSEFQCREHSQPFKRFIDYIWVNKYSKTLTPIRVLGDIDIDYVDEFSWFPNESYPSDHLPMLAQFGIK
ncbi:hypothetical protein KL921_004196 [Ogataea angusta]|uniref:Endonuclease/exonuclease/phosphatase domain-containing protein n=1 Tax=Pichia angusta TaxID=870730 RepID=A0ABQ7RPC4_PICAN|nr:hypothetical protein KL921_004196 [Ogataea angusta]KAG7837694.1 hypothetical protein KL942_004106 [Ogataea angusta]KAG7843797.1 hypothetical protein KL941_004279 [Ogataea angusta]KAG7844991.1 hypothetical protein KL940_005366 [Ogataea angusta]KAG7856787.1 hypothetical protein KL939_003572 [Ogataea angusta]